ncbi:Transmembrane 9 superfamily member [Quillaja saponaria]|uniref:Transmembrane 9 superfamily member n=1 Tax=Quillaja saponaria TaxID=32244 RepID=A0AAD7LUH5_QUISA|nr:Transmembrane 9 superfamily member [Quillaja saponaria]
MIMNGCTLIKTNLMLFCIYNRDYVPLYANKVGPFHNPSETYRHFDLPFCLPAHVQEKTEALGEVLNGDRLVVAPYKLNFITEKQSDVVCKKKLTKEEVAQFRTAVSKDYYFQMYYDDLPIWGFLGKFDSEGPSEVKYYLFKHLYFDILYNEDRVIEVSAKSDPNDLVDLTEDKEVDVAFTYSVKWKETDTPFEQRMDKYSQTSSLPHHLEIHWFSIINTCVTVVLLTGFLATILTRVLKNDFVKYTHDEEAVDDQEETGWKYIHGDVFRYPKYKSLFAAAFGSGTQLFTLAVFIFVLALVGVFLSMQPGSSVYCTCCHICSYIWNCRLYRSFFLLPARRNKLGEEFVINWKPVLWTFVFDFFLSQYRCNCL